MRLGKIRAPYYRIVVADSRTKREGRVIETIGKYHPKQEPSLIEVDSDRARYWLSVGAQPTEPVAAILKLTGDWQAHKGLPAPENGVQTAAPKQDRKAVFEAAAKETIEAAEKPAKKAAAKKAAPAKAKKAAEDKPAEDKPAEDKSAAAAAPEADDKPTEEAPAAETAETPETPAVETAETVVEPAAAADAPAAEAAEAPAAGSTEDAPAAEAADAPAEEAAE
jgi:small subunit ribosomal protein S16